MFIISSIKNGECLFYLTKWVWIKTRKKKKTNKWNNKKITHAFMLFFP